MPETKLVRIKPTSQRVTHVFEGYVFEKSRGWYEIPAEVADRVALERAHDLPTSEAPFVFDVKVKEEAQAIAAVETKKEDPAGTPDKPTKAAVIPPAPPEEPSAHRRGRGR
jgi:hypothetical protein